MCIISKPVKDMSNTNIFISINKSGDRQIIVYSNLIDNNNNNNAMILPIPNPESIQFHDLSDYKDFFKDCNDCFPTIHSAPVLGCLSQNNTLKVFNIGSYQISVAQSLDEILQIDTSIFTMDANCTELLTKEYSDKKFGFIICKIKEGKEHYHPLAYSHSIMENKKLFIPTKHYHGHESKIDKYGFDHSIFSLDNYGFDHSIFPLDNSQTYNIKTPLEDGENYTDDWDHSIFLRNVLCPDELKPFSNTLVSNSKDCEYNPWCGKKNEPINPWSVRKINQIFDIKTNKIDFDFPNIESFDYLTINGKYKNQDIYISL